MAEKFLRTRGLKIIARRWRTRSGEIDLVAMDGDEVVFVEVKARHSTWHGTPAEAVTRTKRDNLRATAAAFLKVKHFIRARYRIDVIAIDASCADSPRITYIRSAVGADN